jgi:hypothetical protein
MLGLSIDRRLIAIGFAALLAASGCSSHPAAPPSGASSAASIAPLAPGTYSYFDGLHTSFTGTFAVSGPASSAPASPTKSK